MNDKDDAGPEQIACLVHFPPRARRIQIQQRLWSRSIITFPRVAAGQFTGSAENRLSEYLKGYHDPATLPNLDGKIKQANSPSLTETK